jgi:hypothetical protein
MMLAIAKEDREPTPAAERAIEKEIVRIVGDKRATEIMVFAKWVAKQVEDANNVSLRYHKLWSRTLSPDEVTELVKMVRRVAAADGPANDRQIQKIAKLEQRLGLAR